MNVVVIKYNAGNIFSMDYALRRLGVEAEITGDAEKIRAADKVIFPGVGEASTTMRYLRERGLDEVIRSLRQPVLGVCIGLQLMCTHSEEGDAECLGIFSERVKRFRPQEGSRLKVPHMGWDTVRPTDGNALFAGIRPTDYVYYVHSFFAETGSHTIATTDYVQPYSASLHKDNFYAVQFHPEKSGAVGERILNNFLTLC